MNRIPSAVDVRLSGYARRPGRSIDCASAAGACVDSANESTTIAVAIRDF
jgi:hypothetical protein